MKLPTLVFACLLVAGMIHAGTVSRIEYFFDADPGFGAGTAIYNRDAVSLDQLISAAALSPGFHRIYVRARNNSGLWGMPQLKAFYIPLPAQPPQPPYGTVSRVEYFFDADPGLGNGTTVYSRNTVTLDQLISAAALSPGFHSVHVRAKNGAGSWGPPQTKTFYIPLSTQPSGPYKNITHLEYWLDTDPGFGLGTVVALSPANSLNANVTLDLSGIPHGNHKLFIRLKNNAGQWSFPAQALFSDGVPAHLTINVTDGVLTLTWEDLYTIDSYRVHTALVPEGPYTLAPGGTYGDSSWSAPFAADPKRFFRVTSLYTLD